MKYQVEGDTLLVRQMDDDAKKEAIEGEDQGRSRDGEQRT